jgi:hypothetical protein
LPASGNRGKSPAKRPGIHREPEEVLLRRKEVEEKARKRTRGPYRKSSNPPQLKVKRKKN